MHSFVIVLLRPKNSAKLLAHSHVACFCWPPVESAKKNSWSLYLVTQFSKEIKSFSPDTNLLGGGGGGVVTLLIDKQTALTSILVDVVTTHNIMLLPSKYVK